MNAERCDLFARLLAYPSDATQLAIAQCRGDAIDRFVEQVAPLTTEALQELYVQTFDLNPTCSLEVGWQLYGENYARGEFLVAMRQTLRRLNIDETTELPDHLTHALTAFGRMDHSEAAPFAAECLLPALEKMRQSLKGPYADLLTAIQTAIRVSYPAAEAREQRPTRSLPVIDPTLEVCHG